MSRTLFQKPRGTGFTEVIEGNRDLRRRPYVSVSVDIEQRRAPTRGLFWRLPLIVRIIVILFVASAGLIFGSVAWLIIGGLTMR